jgi:hypothetical protein
MIWRKSKGDLTLSAGQEPEEFMRAYPDRLHESGSKLDAKFHVISFQRLSAYGYLALPGDESKAELASIANLIQDSINRSAESHTSGHGF